MIKSLFQQVSSPALGLGADECKAQRAANGGDHDTVREAAGAGMVAGGRSRKRLLRSNVSRPRIGKRCNTADAAPRPNPEGRLPAGALRRCGLLVENDYTAHPAPCTASRRQAARSMKPAEIGSEGAS